jgi:maltose-binding protein MalE
MLWPQEIGRLPALLEAFNDPVVQADPILRASADQASIGRLIPTSEAMECVWKSMFGVLPLIWDDLATPQAAAEAMQADAEQCYARLIGRWLYLPVVIKP